MCCRRNTIACTRGKTCSGSTLKLLGLEDDGPSFSHALTCREDLERSKSRENAALTSSVQKAGCCCCVALALVLGVAMGVFLSPQRPALRVSGLRMTGLTPPRPGGSIGELQMQFELTVAVQNPNFVTATASPGTVTILYKDQVLGTATLEDEMEIGPRGVQAVDVTVPVSGLETALGQSIMEDIAQRSGLLLTETRCEMASRVPLLRLLPGHTFSFEAELLTKCMLTSDVRHLPEFAERRCESSHGGETHYMMAD